MARILLDLTGLAFGSLRVLFRVHGDDKAGARWCCLCACGTRCSPRSQKLRFGKQKSCGCRCELPAPPMPADLLGPAALFDLAEITPSFLRERARDSWARMRARCADPHHPAWPKYGALGVGFYPHWSSFDAFLSDMGLPRVGCYSLDRYPNRNGNYEPGNVRWASRERQQRNRSDNFLVTAFGHTYCLADWADILGFDYKRLKSLFRRPGCSIAEIIYTRNLPLPALPARLKH